MNPKHRNCEVRRLKYSISRSWSMCISGWTHTLEACCCLAMRGNARVVTHALCWLDECPPYTKQHAPGSTSKGWMVDTVPQDFREHYCYQRCVISCRSHWGWRTSRLHPPTGNELQSQALEQTHCKWKLCRQWPRLLGITHTRYFSPSTPDSTLFWHN